MPVANMKSGVIGPPGSSAVCSSYRAGHCSRHGARSPRTSRNSYDSHASPTPGLTTITSAQAAWPPPCYQKAMAREPNRRVAARLRALADRAPGVERVGVRAEHVAHVRERAGRERHGVEVRDDLALAPARA